MTREEFFANVQAFKRGEVLQHSDEDAYYNALAIATKMRLAELCGMKDDAAKFEHDLAAALKEHNFKDEVLQAAETEAQERYKNISMSHASNPYKDMLVHGGKWKDHKYIRIENGRYIYADDLKKEHENTLKRYNETMNSNGEKDPWARIRNESDKKISTAHTTNTDKDHYGRTNFEIAKELNEYKHDKTKAGESNSIPDKLYAKNIANIRGLERTAHELNKKSVTEKRALNFIDKLEEEKPKTEKWLENDTEAKKETLKNQTGGDNSKNQAQSEGEAMQKWKDEQKAKEAAAEVRKGDNSAQNANNSMAGYDDWKKQQEKKEFNKKASETVEETYGIKKQSEHPYTKRGVLQDKILGFEYYVTDNAEAYKLYDKYMSDMSEKHDSKVVYSDLVQNVDEDTAKELLKLIMPVAIAKDNKEVDEMYNEVIKNKFTHSLTTREDFYAAIQDYKQKKA